MAIDFENDPTLKFLEQRRRETYLKQMTAGGRHALQDLFYVGV